MTFERALTVAKGNSEAALFLVEHFTFCKLLDDVIDEPGSVTDERLVKDTLCYLAVLCNPGWAKDNSERLFPMMVTAANTWLDSNRLCRSEDKRLVLASEVLKNQCDEMERFVACACGGMGHMREISKDRQFDFDLTPKEGI